MWNVGDKVYADSVGYGYIIAVLEYGFYRVKIDDPFSDFDGMTIKCQGWQLD